MILKIPPGAKTCELTNSVMWFDSEGILCSIPKEEQHDFTNDEIYEEMKRFREFTGDRKVCLLAETHPSHANQPSKEQRKIYADEIASVTKAMAIITTSSLSRMVANLFFSFMPPPYPAKMFKTEQEAREWLRQYCG